MQKPETVTTISTKDASTHELQYWLRQFKRQHDERTALFVAAIEHELMERLEL